MLENLPAEMFPPGDFIEEELEARRWSKGDLADIMGRPPQLVSAIIKGTRRITLDTAADLAAAFGTPAEFWVNLDAAYRLWKKRTEDVTDSERDDVRQRARIFSIAPVGEIVRRQWIPDVRTDVNCLEREILQFLDIKSLDDEPTAKFVARKSTPDVNYAHVAWFKRAYELSDAVNVATFTPNKLDKAIQQLKALAANAEDIRDVPTVLADAGIRFLVIEPLAKTKIDGAAFWLKKHAPVVALSMRYGRIDSFWFTLGHELGHIAAEDGQSLDNDLIGARSKQRDNLTEQEQKADRFSAKMLVPQDRLEQFIIRKGKYFSKNDILGFAQVVGIHPGIVVGQLQYREVISYSHSREMLANVRGVVIDSSLTDGWGHIPSV